MERDREGEEAEMTDAEQLKSVLRYDPSTGHFWWRQDRKSGRDMRSSPAGCLTKQGYIKIRFQKKPVFAHRLAWLYMTGEWPIQQIDHVNGEKSDNRFVNLRLATASQNKANTVIRSDNKTGSKGIQQIRGKWRAKINFNGKQYHLGVFQTKQAAAWAFEFYQRKLFREFARAK